MQTAEVVENYYSLTDFQQNMSEFINRIKETGQPLMLTVDGDVEVVVLDAETYERLLDALEYKETVEAIREGLESMRSGKGMPADEFFEQMRKKYNIPERP